MAALRLLLADDHTILRQGVRRILEQRSDFTIVAEAVNGGDAVREAIRLEPDVAIIDISMPQLNGIEATRQITKRTPTRVLVLSMHMVDAYVHRAVRAGAKGYLLKDACGKELIEGVLSVAAGRAFFSKAIAQEMLADYARRASAMAVIDRYETLSEREREIFHLIAAARTNKEIAAELDIGVTTVETHRAHIFEKLGTHNTAALVRYACRRLTAI